DFDYRGGGGRFFSGTGGGAGRIAGADGGDHRAGQRGSGGGGGGGIGSGAGGIFQDADRIRDSDRGGDDGFSSAAAVAQRDLGGDGETVEERDSGVYQGADFVDGAGADDRIF